MNSSFFFHILLIFFSSLAPALWLQNSLLSLYTLQGCGALVILYIVFKKFFGKGNSNNYQEVFSLVLINLLVQVLIISTGKTSSPLFFLYYFTIFAFSVYYESYQSFTVSLSTIFIYLIFNNPSTLSASGLANLFSLLLISPLAHIFSQSLAKNLESKTKIQNLESDLNSQEADSLLWITTSTKPTLDKVITSVSDLVIYLKSTRSDLRLPKLFLDKIKAIQSDLLTLYSSTEELEESVKNKSDKKEL